MAIINVSNSTRGTKDILSDTDKINLCFNPLTAGEVYSGLTDLPYKDCYTAFKHKELKASDILQAIIVKNNECEVYKGYLAIPSVKSALEAHLKAEKEKAEKEKAEKEKNK